MSAIAIPITGDFGGVQDSLDSGCAFLESRRCADGLWRDFQTLAGASSDWVTAFVCYATRYCEGLSASRFDVLRLLLHRQRPNGGWSYNRTVPTDCDSTAWTLLALSTVPIARPSVTERALRYLKQHLDGASGGFSTYTAKDGIGRFIGVDDPQLLQGWMAPHSCVTAATLQAILAVGGWRDEAVAQGVDFLKARRDETGLWQSYWWTGHAYGTYHAARALALTSALAAGDVERTLRRVHNEQQEDGSWSNTTTRFGDAFATAFSMLALLLYPSRLNRAAARSGAAWLITQQTAEGGWLPAPNLRIPPPMAEEPEALSEWRVNQKGTGVVIEDSGAVFTSAAALWALSILRSMPPGS